MADDGFKIDFRNMQQSGVFTDEEIARKLLRERITNELYTDPAIIIQRGLVDKPQRSTGEGD